jgi:hypothetical protein
MDWIGPTQNPKKNFSKSTIIFLLFISHQSLFYYYSNKKVNTKQKFSFFYTKQFYFFSHINQIYYSTVQLSQVQSITKHSMKSTKVHVLKRGVARKKKKQKNKKESVEDGHDGSL